MGNLYGDFVWGYLVLPKVFCTTGPLYSGLVLPSEPSALDLVN